MAYVALRALGYGHAPSAVDTDAAVLRALTARPGALVVLDNLEHLQPEGAAVIRQWMSTARGVRFVVTSRVALDIPNEHVVELSGKWRTVDAVELFVERVRARMTFAPSEAELSRASERSCAGARPGAARDRDRRSAHGLRGRPPSPSSARVTEPSAAPIASAFSLLRPPRSARRSPALFARSSGSFSLQAVAAVAGERRAKTTLVVELAREEPAPSRSPLPADALRDVRGDAHDFASVTYSHPPRRPATRRTPRTRVSSASARASSPTPSPGKSRSTRSTTGKTSTPRLRSPPARATPTRCCRSRWPSTSSRTTAGSGAACSRCSTTRRCGRGAACDLRVARARAARPVRVTLYAPSGASSRPAATRRPRFFSRRSRETTFAWAPRVAPRRTLPSSSASSTLPASYLTKRARRRARARGARRHRRGALSDRLAPQLARRARRRARGLRTLTQARAGLRRCRRRGDAR